MTKIMVVDDEKDLLILMKEILENEKFEVITAQSGAECLKKLKTVKPDLILLDMMMPKMSGYEVIENIRKNPKTKDIKIAFLTVTRMSEDSLYKLSKFNISDYITKPFDVSDAVSRVKKIINK